MIDRYNTKNPTVGTLYLTATHLIFVDPDSNKETWVSNRALGTPKSVTSSLYPLPVACPMTSSIILRPSRVQMGPPVRFGKFKPKLLLCADFCGLTFKQLSLG